MKRLFLSFVLSICLAEVATGEEYRGVFWNLESGDSSAGFIASQVVAKGAIDFWGFSEVSDQATVDTLKQALEAANPSIPFVAKLSEDGGGDRLAIIYRSDRMTAIPYAGSATVDDIGNQFFEIDSINVGGTLRPALGVQLQATDGHSVVVLVNHWKCCGGDAQEQKRERQAILMNAFAIATPGVPIIAAGDFNIPINNGGRATAAFNQLSRLWEYKETAPDVGSHQSGSILDAVFVTNKVPGWDSVATVLERDGNSAALGATFSDDANQTDHRPLLLVVASDSEERLDGLREAIAEMEAALARMKAELARLDANP